MKLEKFSVGVAFVDDSAPNPTSKVLPPSKQNRLVCDPEPKYIEGQPITKDKTAGKQFGPKAEILGNSVEIGSIDRSSQYTESRSWWFEAEPGWQDHDALRSASWTWHSNRWRKGNEDRGSLYGGLAFRHNRQPTSLICTFRGKPGWKFNFKTPRPEIHSIRPQQEIGRLDRCIQNLGNIMARMNCEPAARELTQLDREVC